MHSESYVHICLAATSFFSLASASTCRNFTNPRFGSDTPSQFSNTNTYTLENVSCPANAANRTCKVPRGTYSLNIRRTLNISVSEEDEDAIFEVARVAYWSRYLANNMSFWDDEWDDKPRFVDTRESSQDDWSDIFFDTDAGLNYTLGFVAFMRWGFGILGGCDNETLNGMGVALRAPYETKDEEKGNITEVSGTLLGSGRNTTRDNTDSGSGRNDVCCAGVLGIMLTLSLGFAVFC